MSHEERAACHRLAVDHAIEVNGQVTQMRHFIIVQNFDHLWKVEPGNGAPFIEKIG